MAGSHTKDLEWINQTAKRVILLMARKEIPMIPENYTLFYDYTLGINSRLREEIGDLLNHGVVFTEELSKSLYEKYYGNIECRGLFTKVSDEIQKILKEVLKDIAATGGAVTHYNSSLKKYVDALDGATDVSEIKKIVGDIILDTHTMEKTTATLRQQLEAVSQESQKLQEQLKEAKQEAIIDALTGLYNRKYMQEKLDELYTRFIEDGAVFSLIMLDIDYFKKINDRYGHKIGDSVLEYTGSVIKGAVKGRDTPVRYGGEEFMIILPGTTCRNACYLAESIRKEISEKALKIKKTQELVGRITVSMGVTEIREGDTLEKLIVRADQLLYLAKERGRNNVQSDHSAGEAATEMNHTPMVSERVAP